MDFIDVFLVIFAVFCLSWVICRLIYFIKNGHSEQPLNGAKSDAENDSKDS